MSVKTKIFILLIITFGLTVSSTLVYQYLNYREQKVFLQQLHKHNDKIVSNYFRFKNEKIEKTLADYTLWDEIVKMIEKNDLQWAKQNLDRATNFYEICSVLVFDKSDSLIYQTCDSNFISAQDILSDTAVSKLFNNQPACHFYTLKNGNVIEIFGSKIHSGNDNTEEATTHGYLFFVKLWDKLYMSELEKSVGTKPIIKLPDNKPIDKKSNNFSKNLTDWQGITKANLIFYGDNSFDNEISRLWRKFTILSILLTIFSISLFFAATHIWITRPLNLIENALQISEIKPLLKLKGKNNEFTDIAKLIEKSFIQQNVLETEIVEHERTENALRQSEKLQRILLNILPDIVYIHKNGKFVYANQATIDFLEYSLDEIMNLYVLDIIDLNYRELANENMEKRNRGEIIPEYEIEIISKTGKKRNVLVRSSQIKQNDESGVLVVLVDITERKTIENTLKEAEERFRNLFNNSLIGIYRTTTEGKVVMANPALIAMLGYQSIDDLNAFNVIHGYKNPDDHERFRKIIISEKEVLGFETEWVKSNGTIIFVRENARLIRNELDNCFYFEGTVEDISEKKKLENLMNQKNIELFEANKIIEEKNKNITDSIRYAVRIQQAVIPPRKVFENLFDDHFIFFRPKDIVSGDFYWLECDGDDIIFSAVDCTGHGVPGGFMSIIASNILNQALKENKLKKPSEILNFLNLTLKNTIHQQMEENLLLKDGMDLAVCCYNKKTNLLQYAGAYNPMYIVRNKELIIGKPDKYPIGLTSEDTTYLYSCKEFTVFDGDAIYLFSDGYPDQIGGKNDRKFLSSQFRETLVEISHHPMQIQHNILEDTLVDWMGDHEQLDDILVLGIRI